MKKILTIFLLALFGLVSCSNDDPKTIKIDSKDTDDKKDDQPKEQEATIIAFGSCNRQNADQPLWDDIVNQQPFLWIWLGDNIYGDTKNMNVLESKYNLQKQNSGYQKLVASVEVIGTWDDHDFGKNNGGIEFGPKAESQQRLLDFLDVPANAPARSREGVYQSFTYGEGDHKIKVILLDCRYFNDERAGKLLGDDQWAWLEKELSESTAQVNIIGNGIQIIPEDHKYEKWANFPAERQRLFNLIEKYNVKNPILLSGDRHIAEISRLAIGEKSIYEVTSSGLTHSWSTLDFEANQHRVGKLITELNYGTIKIDWTATPSTISLSLHGDHGKDHDQVIVKMEE